MKYYKLLLVFISFFSTFIVYSEGCEYDTQCKGDRICESGVCVAPDPDSTTANPVGLSTDLIVQTHKSLTYKVLNPPNRKTAMKDLFGITSPTGKVRTAANKLSSFWFEHSFKNGTENEQVIFFISQSIDENGQLNDTCRACKVEVGAITYKQVSDQWQIISKQPKLGEIGQWGEIPKVKDPKAIQLSPSVHLLMINEVYANYGHISEGETLLAFSKNQWRNIGFVQTNGDNSGDCDDEAVPVDAELKLGPCWSYKGTISLIAGKNVEYPDLLITRKGTESGEHRVSVIPAKNVIYTFNGEDYVAPEESP